jgi:predicted phosphodiesterase
MRTIILSDVHANDAALQAVLNHAYRHGRPDELWFLGDLVGYGPDPWQAWEALSQEPVPRGCWLAGNHDWGLVRKLAGPETLFPNEADSQGITVSNFRDVAWQIIAHQQALLEKKDDLQNQLAAVPVMSRPRPGIFLAHGGFNADVERAILRYYNFPIAPPVELVAGFETAVAGGSPAVYDAVPNDTTPPQLFAYGHTHIAGIWQWAGQGQWRKLPLDSVHSLPGPAAGPAAMPLCVNPGSVGFPRDGGCPSYVEVDWQAQTLALHRVQYDMELTREKMQNGVGPYRRLLNEPGFLDNPGCQSA